MSTVKKNEVQLQVGKPAPKFSLPDEKGVIRKLSEFKGKPLVVFFYPKDMTPGCTTESCDFRDSKKRLAAFGAVVLGVSADSVESHKKFIAKHELNFSLLSDPEKTMLMDYGVWQEKSLYGRVFMGIVRTTVVIDSRGNMAAIFSKVKVKGHMEEVLESLQSLSK